MQQFGDAVVRPREEVFDYREEMPGTGLERKKVANVSVWPGVCVANGPSTSFIPQSNQVCERSGHALGLVPAGVQFSDQHNREQGQRSRLSQQGDLTAIKNGKDRSTPVLLLKGDICSVLGYTFVWESMYIVNY